jgi:hypothetical protein
MTNTNFKARLLVAAVVLLAYAPAAQAEATIVNPDGSQNVAYQRALDASRMPSPDVVVTVHRETCPDASGVACAISRDVYLGTSFEPNRFLHEMGHQFDYSATDTMREAFEEATHDSRPWRTAPNSPNEQFAEAYRICARWGGRTPFLAQTAGYDFRVLASRQPVVCRIIQDEAQRDGFTQNAPRHLLSAQWEA